MSESEFRDESCEVWTMYLRGIAWGGLVSMCNSSGLIDADSSRRGDEEIRCKSRDLHMVVVALKIRTWALRIDCARF